MSIKVRAYILLTILGLGIISLIYILIKDRIEIIRSLKPNSVADFFSLNYSYPRYIIPSLIFNTFALIIWVPFWLLDKLFNLGIFKDKKH